MVIMLTKQFQRARANFTECSKLFKGYESTVDAVLANAKGVNSYIRKNYDVEQWEIDRLDEILRDVGIYATRVKHVNRKLDECGNTLVSLNKYLTRKNRNKEVEHLRTSGWVEMFLTCYELQRECSLAFREAEKKWSLIETDIMFRHN